MKAHLEHRRGTRYQARAYCKKIDTQVGGPWEWGKWIGGQGHRSDWDSLKESLQDGCNNQSLVESHFNLYVRYSNGIEKARLLLAPKVTDVCKLVVLHGEPGTGKSWFAQNTAMDGLETVMEKTTYQFMRGVTGAWWTGYAQENCIVMDEFDGHTMDVATFLNLFDTTPKVKTVHVHGGVTQFTSKICVITSNSSPREWWPNISDMKFKAVERRIAVSLYFKHGQLCLVPNCSCRCMATTTFRFSSLFSSSSQ